MFGLIGFSPDEHIIERDRRRVGKQLEMPSRVQPIADVAIINLKGILDKEESLIRQAELEPDYDFRGDDDLDMWRGMICVQRLNGLTSNNAYPNPNMDLTPVFCSPAGMKEVPIIFAGQVKKGASLTNHQSTDVSRTISGLASFINSWHSFIPAGTTVMSVYPDHIIKDGKKVPRPQYKSLPGKWFFMMKPFYAQDIRQVVFELYRDALEYLKNEVGSANSVDSVHLEHLRKMAQERDEVPGKCFSVCSPLERLIETMCLLHKDTNPCTPAVLAALNILKTPEEITQFFRASAFDAAAINDLKSQRILLDQLFPPVGGLPIASPAGVTGWASRSAEEKKIFMHESLMRVCVDYLESFKPVIMGVTTTGAAPEEQIDVLLGHCASSFI